MSVTQTLRTLLRTTHLVLSPPQDFVRALLAPLVLATTSGYAAAEVPIIPGDLRYDQGFGLYHAAADGDIITWPPGTYHMAGDYGSAYCFWLFPQDMTGYRYPRTNLTINATGVTIVVTNPDAGVFFLRECHGLIVNGLTVTYNPLPYNQSTVTSVNLATNTFEVLLEPGYLGFENPFFAYGSPLPPDPHTNYGVIYDLVTNLPKAGVNPQFCRIDSYQNLGAGRYSLKMIKQVDENMNNIEDYLEAFSVDDRFVYNGRQLGKNIFDLAGFEPVAGRPPVTLNSCKALAATSIFIVLRECPRLSSSGQAEISNCDILTGDPNRLISTNASLAFLTNCRVGPLIEDCDVERPSDDGIDLHGDARIFWGYPNEAWLDYTVIDLDAGPRLAQDDELQVFFPPTGQVVYASIAGFEVGGGPADEDPKRVRLNIPVPNMVAIPDNPATPENESLPATRVWNVSSSCPDFLIRNNVFRIIRGDGSILNARGGLYAGNTIDVATERGITVANISSNGVNWKQGPVPSNITISNNTIKNCAYPFTSTKTIQGASILVAAFNGLGWLQPATHKSVSGIVLEANTIEDWNTMGIYARALTNSQIRPIGSTFHKFKGAVAAASRAIDIEAPAGLVTVDGVNTTQATGLQYAVRIGPGVDPDVTATRIFVHYGTRNLEDLR